MNEFANAKNRRGFLLSFVVLALIAAIIIIPRQFRSEAGNAGKDISERTVSVEKSLENYDIRTDKNQGETLINFRQTAGRDAVAIADSRDKFVVGETALRQKVPTLKVEYNEDIRIPEVITPDVAQGRAFLTSPSNAKRADILRSFVGENKELIGVKSTQVAQLNVVADYTNPDGNLSYAHLEQTINGVPVFRGEVKAGFTRHGEMFRVINNLAPDLDYESLSTDFGNALDAVKVASENIKFELKPADLARNNADSTDLKNVFGTGDSATTAEKMYFPTEPGVARASWRVLIWEPTNAYYVIVDAETKTVLWRKNITSDQTQPATYGVYSNPDSMLNVAENPAPFTPSSLNPGLGTQGTQITRNTVTLIGNEGVNSFNNLGWITDNTNGTDGWTDGNAVQAGLDIDGTDGVDAPVNGTNRSFVFSYNPPPGIGGAPDDIIATNSRNGAVTQLFYINNRYHDELYKLGFTEAARNFQNDNFGRGGVANDRVRGEAQDSAGTNNANFSTPADGGRGRMQMYRFTQTPARDGDLDADVVVHEHTHGLSSRLIGNGSGLSTNRAGSMGEGWSDFYGLSLLSQASDPIMGVYTTGSYVTLNVFNIGTTNSYYGIRRFPYAVRAYTGGPNNRPYNPLTFADLNTGCNLSDGAYAPSAPFAANACNEVHNGGEVWAINLWEVRARFVQRLGWAVGNRKMLQLVTDGMKLTPNNPNFLQARDGIVAAAQASSLAPEAGIDVSDVWAGFAVRGMGFSATDNGTTAVEAFDTPNVLQTPTFSFSDAAPGGDGDGFAEPGETVVLSIPLSNNSGSTITGVTLELGGNTVSYGDIANGATVVRTINYLVPAATVCGSNLTLTLNINGSAGATTLTRSLSIGSPIVALSQNFDSVTAPTLPSGWTNNLVTGTVINWVTSTATPSSSVNSAFANDPATSGEAALEMPAVTISSATARLKFRINYNTEATWDGVTLNIKVGSGAYQDILAAGGTFISGAYPTSLSTGSFPQAGRAAWTGNSNGYVDVEATLPASANGQSVQFRWNASSDTSVGGTGTFVDDVQLINNFNCTTTTTTISKARADFDGDGKTDFSVFRPGDGNWYLSRSTAGFTALSFGASGDKLVPGDFDGDGKTDVAVMRPNSLNTALFFYALRSGNSTVIISQWGAPSDVPAMGDYDGDGKTDVAVFRPSNGTWYVQNSGGGTTGVQFGQSGDIPVANDYDGDGKTDIAVFRPSNATWYINKSTGGVQSTTFGLATDKLVPADYNGDGKADIAVFRPSNGTWYTSTNPALNYGAIVFGSATDVPVPGDYDGDGKTDVAVFRNGAWYVSRSSGGLSSANFGLSSDLPVPAQYIP